MKGCRILEILLQRTASCQTEGMMKQEEKTKRTQSRILDAAIVEFGTKSYDAASINTICLESQISKGLLYHNFKGKEELYLQCVKICCDKFLDFLKTHYKEQEDAKSSIQKLLSLRQVFFQENPYYSYIFFSSMLQPPPKLAQEIQQIHQDFAAFNMTCFRKLLHMVKLREGVSEEVALESFLLFGEMYNSYYQKKFYQEKDYQTLWKDHDKRLSAILNVILYGIAQED